MTTPASPWRDIESAPKDGTPFLMWCPKGARNHYMPSEGFEGGVYYLDDPRLKWFDDDRYAIGYWRPWAVEGKTQHPWGDRNRSEPHPTHWMPLPEPPK